MNYNSNTSRFLRTSLQDPSGERYLSENDLSAPRYQLGGAAGATAPEYHRQTVPPAGSENNTGLQAVQAEQDAPSVLMDVTVIEDRQGPHAPAWEEASSRPPSSMEVDPPVVPKPKRPKKERKPLIQVATLNVRGLAARRRSDKNKLQSVIRWMRAEKVSIVALQESYDCTAIFEEAERSNEKVWAFPNPGTAHSAGTGFIVHRDSLPNSLKKEDVKHEILIQGRLDTLSWRWGETDLRIANLYAPSSAQVAEPFFRKVTELLKTEETSMVLGDWNHVESELDRSSGNMSTRAVRDAIRDLRRALSVEDAWREENPTTSDFTWESPAVGTSGQTSRSRLDRILLSDEMAARSTEHLIDVGLTVSDHYPVRVKIIDDESPDVGRGRWKLNLEDLEDDHAMEKCRLILLKCQRQTGRTPMSAWLEAKESIKKVLINRQTMRRKERGKLLANLEVDRQNILAKRNYRTQPGLIAMESNLRERIASIKEGKMRRATESSSARFAEKGESVNKYWFSIGKSIKESSIIKALTDDDEETERNTARMAEIARKHHSRLQAAQSMTNERSEACRKMESMAKGKEFPENARTDIDAEITTEDVEDAISAAQTGKSPGKDGIPYEFYKYWMKRLRLKQPDEPEVPSIAGILAKVWNDIANGNVPPKEYVEGLMFLLYKKKRRDKVENYRPITLLGCDYKLQTKVLTTRLGRNVSGVLHPDQAGFVPGRDILDHVKLAKHVKELCDTMERDGALVALDQEKAYDRIDHEYLWRMLEAYKAPPRFVGTVQRLYRHATTRVLLNQTESDPFNVRRGVRQGDPLSCLLFNLAIEPLAESLRKSSLKGISIPGVIERLVVRLFADDTQVYLSKFDRWSKVKAVTDEWCLASTAKFNQEKTEVLPMGSEVYRKEVCKWKCIRPERIRTTEILPRGARMVQDKQPLRILGGIVGHKVDEASIWEPVVTKIEALADKWSKKRLTLRGRRLIVSFLMQSKAQYMLSTNDPPRTVIDRIAKASHRVMWAGKKRGLTTMEIVEQPIQEGGFGVPNFLLRTRTARIMTGKKWCAPKTTRPMWADVVDELIRLSSRNPDDPRKQDVLFQTWKETSGKTSTLPRDVQAMLKEMRRYDLRVETLRLNASSKDETPIWMSRSTELTLKEENSAPMRALRRNHHVMSMGDLRNVSFANAGGCREHRKCIEAVEAIVRKTTSTANVRFQTPLLEGENGPSDLSFTHRRKEKATRDFEEGNPVAINPAITHKGELREALRIFGVPMERNRLPAYRSGPGASDEPILQLWTDGSTTDFGKKTQKIGYGIWCEDDAFVVSSKIDHDQATNNRAELMALVVALSAAPTNRHTRIMTDSQYVVTGYHSTSNRWEDWGWLGVTNGDLWRTAKYLARIRTGKTEVLKVEAHSGIHGNEEADRLAKEGADGETELVPNLDVPVNWQLQGAKIGSLTYGATYEWIRRREATGKKTMSPTNVERVLEVLLDVHETRTTEAKLWLSLRKPYIRKEISDFLWTMIHGRSRCGSMFSKWGPEWEDMQFCDCGAVESMEHILVGCDDAIWRINLWGEMADLLKRSKIIPERLCRPPSFPEIMGLGLVDAGNRVATRLLATIVSETAFTVWKLRNRKRFDETQISTRMAIDLWRGSLEKRARTDLALQRLSGPKTASEAQRAEDATAAWRRIISIKGSVTIWSSADYG